MSRFEFLVKYSLLLIFIFSSQLIAGPRVLLESSSETLQADSIASPDGLVEFILQLDLNDAASIRECAEENGIEKNNYSDLFVVSKVDLSSAGAQAYFVRPAITPFCGIFYGAHVFRYWFVEEKELFDSSNGFRVMFLNYSDDVSVFESEINGYKDIESMRHTAGHLFTTTFRYNGEEYQAAQCEAFDLATRAVSPCED